MINKTKTIQDICHEEVKKVFMPDGIIVIDEKEEPFVDNFSKKVAQAINQIVERIEGE